MAPSESEFPRVPETAEAMAARWAERDAMYANARIPMSSEMEAATRHMRMQEANRLPNIKERGRMFARAKSWTPPVHPDYGSLRDWVN